MVEQGTHNPLVAGSSPAGPTRKIETGCATTRATGFLCGGRRVARSSPGLGNGGPSHDLDLGAPPLDLGEEFFLVLDGDHQLLVADAQLDAVERRRQGSQRVGRLAQPADLRDGIRRLLEAEHDEQVALPVELDVVAKKRRDDEDVAEDKAQRADYGAYERALFRRIGEELRERPRQHDVDAHRQRVIPPVHFPREPHRLTHDAPSIRRHASSAKER